MPESSHVFTVYSSAVTPQGVWGRRRCRGILDPELSGRVEWSSASGEAFDIKEFPDLNQ